MVFAGWYTSRLIKRGRSDACLSLAMFGAIGLGIFGALMPIMPTSILSANSRAASPSRVKIAVPLAYSWPWMRSTASW